MATTRVWRLTVFLPGKDEPEEITYENDGVDPRETSDLAQFLTEKYGEGWELYDVE